MADKVVNEPGYSENLKRLWVDQGDGTYAPKVSASVSSSGADGAIQDGSNPTIEATVFDRANSNPLATQLVDSNGDPVSVGGGTQYAEDTASAGAEQVTMAGVVRKDTGASLVDTDGDRTELQVDSTGNLRVNVAAGGTSGTQYTEADTDATITGTAVMWEDASDTLRAVSAAKPLPVGDAGGSLTVDGSVSVSNFPAVQPVSDNGGSLTVDGTVSIGNSPTVDTELTTADLDTGAGTDTRAVVGLVRAESGGGLLVGSANPLPVNDAGGSLTVDGTVDIGNLPNEGQQTMANSISVALASNQSALPVTDNAGSLTVDNGGTFAVQDSEKLADNAGFTDGTTKVNPVGFIFDEVAGTALTENDIAAGRLDSKRAQVLVLEDETTRGRRATVTASNALKTDSSATTQPVSGTVTANQGTAGTAWKVVGDVAADAAINANPVTTGGRASTAVPTAMSADGDAAHLWLDRLGRPQVQLGVPVGTEKWATAQYTTAQTGTALLTPTSGKKLVITSVQIQVGGTTAGNVQLWFGGSADTTYTRGTDRAIFDGEFAPSATLKPGFAQTKESGWVAGAADDILRVTTSAAINPITFTVWGYEI